MCVCVCVCVCVCASRVPNFGQSIINILCLIETMKSLNLWFRRK